MANKFSNWWKTRKIAKKPVKTESINDPQAPLLDPEYLVAQPEAKTEASKTKTRSVKLATQKRYFKATSNTNPLAGTQLEIIDNNKPSELQNDTSSSPKKSSKKHQNWRLKLKTAFMIKRGYLSGLIISQDKYKRASLMEKIVKFIIYAAMRIVIKPSRWKDPKKNYLLIDKAYEKIMSSDFIYIPSSMAFYIIMAFMPITSLIVFLNSLDFLKPVLELNGESALPAILGDFVPGFRDLLSQVNFVTNGFAGNAAQVGAYAAIVLSLFISVWIASGGFAKLVYTQSHLYGHKFVGGYWMNRLKGMSMVLGLTIYLLLALLINISVVRVISESTLLNNTGKEAIRIIFLLISLFFVIFIGMILTFRFSPRFKTKIRYILSGAMTTTLPTTGFLLLFGSITSLWSYSKFGALGAIMYVAMSSLIISYFLFVGITVNASYHHAFVGPIEKKWTISKK